MTIGSNEFNVYCTIQHKDSGYSFKQNDDQMVRVGVGLSGVTIAYIPIPDAWYHTAKDNIIDITGLKVLAIEWLKENWENK